jgi:hypothetical protein
MHIIISILLFSYRKKDDTEKRGFEPLVVNTTIFSRYLTLPIVTPPPGIINYISGNRRIERLDAARA